MSREANTPEKGDFEELAHGSSKSQSHVIDKSGSSTTINSRTTAPRSNNEVSLKGWRLLLTMLAAFTALFLSMLDTSIVAVALPTIANEFQNFSDSNWIFTAYMITYMAFGIILARLSDIFGLAFVEILSMIVFMVFSLACALSKSMLQLIIFRSFQGIGGSGMFSMATVIGAKVLPTEKLGMLATYVASTQTVSVILGPILSGVITGNGSWPWIFWLNLPVCGSALVVFLLAWPRQKETGSKLLKGALARVDFLGGGLLLAASILLIFALQQAGTHVYAWDSAATIACLTISGLSFVGFVGWQVWLVSKPKVKVQYIFPIHLASERVLGSAIIVTILNGFIWYIAIINLPERFQIVGGDGPVAAGLRLLPLMGAAAVGTVGTGALLKKGNFTAITTILGSGLQVLGYGLMTTLGNRGGIPTPVYGYQVLLGIGFGMSIGSTMILSVLQCLKRPEYTAVMQGAQTQCRTLGGSIGLAIATIIFNNKIMSSSRIYSTLTPTEVESLYRSPLVISTFSLPEQQVVGEVFADAFTAQMWAAMYVAVAALVVSVGTIERHPPWLQDEASNSAGSEVEMGEDALNLR